MKKLILVPLLLGIGVAGWAGCGGDGGGDTTVVQTTPAPTEKTTTVTQPAPNPKPQPQPGPAPVPEPPPSEPPDVVGLSLPTAKKQLKEAGFKADVSNTDTTFGIIVESNYTVCTQDDPRGDIVPILAQKYEC